MNHSPDEAIGLAYDTVAQTYADLLPDTSFEAPIDLAMIGHLVAILPGPRILDAGCGAGRMVSHLASLDSELRVSGVDLSREMVRRTRALGIADDVVEGHLNRLPHPDAAFDGILAWYSIIHVAPGDLSGPMAEFCRVLRPGGAVLVAFQAGDGRRREIRRAYGHDVDMAAFLHSTDHVVGALRAAGLEPLARLERVARATDSHPQAFVLARRIGDAEAPVSSV